MEEYEIRNLYNRKDLTKLEIVEPKIRYERPSRSTKGLKEITISLEFNVLNIGKSIETLFKLEIHIPKNPAIQSNAMIKQELFKYLVRHENDYSIFSIPNQSPIFQNELSTVGNYNFVINHHTVEYLSEPIKLKLFYSNGTEEIKFYLLDHLNTSSKKLTKNDFII
jgi:hypothetical protein